MIGKLKSSTDFGPKRRLAWRLIRHLLPAQTRWFVEGDRHLPGQLWYGERKMMYEAVRRSRPVACFEIGTWRGGGSTLFITQALFENNKGILHTVETDPALQQAAKNSYERYLPHLLPFVEFHLGDFRRAFMPNLQNLDQIDFLFLDGAEDAAQTHDQYKFFEPWLKPGSLLLAHDWLTDKCRLIKPLIENSDEWEVMHLLLPPASLGLMMARKKHYL